MSQTLNETPNGSRLQIGVFGKRNSGKSSLVNRLCGEEVSIVSSEAGTTTDPVRRAMEIAGLGPCLLIDTPGFDDAGALGELRVIRTKQVIERCDLAVLVVTDCDLTGEQQLAARLKSNGVPVLFVINKADALDPAPVQEALARELGVSGVAVSCKTGAGLDQVFAGLQKLAPKEEERSVTAHLLKGNDLVLLVMPQDLQAPRGRLILPQVQTIRDLLDQRAVVVCATMGELPRALASLGRPPDLIITDSQMFREVAELRPKESKLTSFSVLFARYKGDAAEYERGARAIDRLKAGDRVLIAESCSHLPLDGDIARVKLPALLGKKAGGPPEVTVVSGQSFPEDLSAYRLVIMCGGCMASRRQILARIDACRRQGVPVTNYGIALAKLTGVQVDAV